MTVVPKYSLEEGSEALLYLARNVEDIPTHMLKSFHIVLDRYNYMFQKIGPSTLKAEDEICV